MAKSRTSLGWRQFRGIGEPLRGFFFLLLRGLVGSGMIEVIIRREEGGFERGYVFIGNGNVAEGDAG